MSLMHDDIPLRDATKGTWVIALPGVPKSANILRHMHWAEYAKVMSDWYYLVRAADGFLAVSMPTGKRWIIITRHGRKCLDRDNLYSSVKPLVDVLRPPRHESGILKSGKNKGKPWSRDRIGHGLILDDDEAHLDLKVVNGTLEKGQEPYTTILISDRPFS